MIQRPLERRAVTTSNRTSERPESSPSSQGAPSPNVEPRIRTAIAVLMTRFPQIDETFILREIDELERQGQPVLVVPLLRSQQKVVHEEAKPWVKRALYMPLLSPAIFASNLKSFLRGPRRYLRLLWTLIVGTILRPSTLIRTLALFPKSVHLAMVLPKRGIRHVHAHFASHATTMAFIISSLSDITYSFTVHGPDVFVHRMLLREKIAGARFIRSISMFNKAFLCGLFPALTEGKIEVVHSGVNPEVYEQAALEHEPAPAQPSPKRKLRLLSVAALTPSRGFPFLVDACARLVRSGAEIECRIVGAGPLRGATEQWIVEHGLSDAVKLVGLLPQHEVARLMGEADIFVLPSVIAVDGQMDGIPVSLMEAMAAGKPVIASTISGIPELVKDNVNGILVDAAYAGRLAEAVQRLYADPLLRERLGRAGQLKVRQEFDLRRNAAALVALFDRHRDVSSTQTAAVDRVTALNWSRLETCALGVRRVHERHDSFVAEVTITDGITRRDVIVRQPRAEEGQAPPHERARTEFEVLTMLHEAMVSEQLDATGRILCSVPRLLMFDEPHHALVTARADGKALAGICGEARTRSIAPLITALRRAGTWLSVMQSHTHSGEDARHVLTAVVVLATRDLELAAAGDPFVRRRRDAILERLHTLEARLAERPLPVVGHHGDYAPDNIFVGNRRVEVIDFSSYREGLPFEDIAQLLVHLELCAFPLGRQLPKLRRALLEGYGSVDEEQ
ncbi:MAG TPA: glycosyltransferase, partial [Thermoanaerobaculia bacterium]|nr:glycosyltransferase [Thermoanaerobaculia bacterium]